MYDEVVAAKWASRFDPFTRDVFYNARISDGGDHVQHEEEPLDSHEHVADDMSADEQFMDTAQDAGVEECSEPESSSSEQ